MALRKVYLIHVISVIVIERSPMDWSNERLCDAENAVVYICATHPKSPNTTVSAHENDNVKEWLGVPPTNDLKMLLHRSLIFRVPGRALCLIRCNKQPKPNRTVR